MAAKKKRVTKSAVKKQRPTKQSGSAKPRESAAVTTLASLPALTGKLRLAYRASFSDEQSSAWGEKTKAGEVIREAEKAVAVLARSLGDDTQVAYSRRRLAYLCELLVLLEDEVARTDGSPASRHTARGAALSLAANARRELARLIRAVAGGRQAIHAAVDEAAPKSERSASDVQDSLTATIDLAVKLRRDEVTEALADDVGLTEARLNSAWAALEVLTGAAEVALNPADYEGDAPSVNLIEGRVLRELQLAKVLFDEARARGVKVPAVSFGPALTALFRE